MNFKLRTLGERQFAQTAIPTVACRKLSKRRHVEQAGSAQRQVAIPPPAETWEVLAKLVVRVNLIAGLGKTEGRGRPFLA